MTTATTTAGRVAAPSNNVPHTPSRWYGVALAVGLGVVALMLGRAMPVIGGPVFGILLGMALRNTIGVGPLFRPGLGFASKQMLQWSIVALGFGLSIQQVARTGLDAIWVTLITIAVAFASAWLLGRWLRITPRLNILIGVGTAICGGSAIAAATPIIKPEEEETAFAISTIFIFNIVAVFTFPALGHLLGMSDAGFGMWAGTAINDTSSVVAAAYSYSVAAGDYATIVKLTRAAFIIPICIGLALLVAWREKKSGQSRLNIAKIFPWFILWFVVASAVRSTGIIPEQWLSTIHLIAQFMIVVALTAVGLSSDLGRMRTAGVRPVLLGLGVWIAVAGSSLAVQGAMGAW